MDQYLDQLEAELQHARECVESAKRVQLEQQRRVADAEAAIESWLRDHPRQNDSWPA